MDKMHGFGTYSWPDGRVYEGHWRNNTTHGTGKFTMADDSVEEKFHKKEVKHGLWENGKRVKWFENPEHEALRLQHNKQQDVNNEKQKALKSENQQL